MTTQNRIKTVLTLAAVAILALAIGQVQAAPVTVPNGDFTIYKPGTSYTITAIFAPGYASGLGDNLAVKGSGGIAEYSDGTSGGFVDCPGWVLIQGTNDLVGNGVDGSVGLNAFAAWGGDTKVESAESLGNIAGSSTYTLSAVVVGGAVAAGPLTLELRADGVPVTPSSSVDPGGPGVISRTYDAGAMAGHLGKPMTIVIGDKDENDIGGRVVFDNVTLDVESTDANLPDVDAGIDMITWSGQAVPMDANVVNNDTNEPQGTLTYLWTAEPNGIGDPNLDVAITDANQEDASVTITKTAPTGDATVVTMTLAVTLPGKDPVADTMTIYVYDDACLAAKAAGPVVIDPTDIDGNCITNFEDFAVMAITWFYDYTLTEPVVK